MFDARPPVLVLHKRQRPPEQPSRCDSLDALFEEQQLPCAEPLLSHGVQPFDGGQQPSEADLTVGSPVASALRPDVAARDVTPDSSHTPASADHAKPDTASAVGTPAAVFVLVAPETASLSTHREGAASHISKPNPWAKDAFEVFKPRGWGISARSILR